MKEILEEIQDGWEKQEISHLNTITLANLSEQTAETVEQVVASLLPNRRLWRHVVLLLVCLVEDREMLNQICRPSDVQTLLLNSALLALECPSSLRDNDTIAERLSSVMTDVSACIHRIIQVWTDPVFIAYAPDSRHYAVSRNLVLLLARSSSGIDTQYMRFVKYYIECSRLHTRARGLACIEIIVEKSSPDDTTLDFELDPEKYPDIQKLRAYARGESTAVSKTVDVDLKMLDIKETADIVDSGPNDSDDDDEFPAYPIPSKAGKTPRYPLSTPHIISRLYCYVALLKNPDPAICSTLSALSTLLNAVDNNSNIEDDNIECATVVPSLLPLLVSLQDTYDSPDFARCRFEAIVSCLHAYPRITSLLVSASFDTSKYGLGIRVDALRALSSFFMTESKATTIASSSTPQTCGTVTRVSRRLAMSRASFSNWLGPTAWLVISGLMKAFIKIDLDKHDAMIVNLVLETLSIIMYTCRTCIEATTYFGSVFEFIRGVYNLDRGYSRSSVKKAVGVALEFVHDDRVVDSVAWVLQLCHVEDESGGEDDIFLMQRVKERMERFEGMDENKLLR